MYCQIKQHITIKKKIIQKNRPKIIRIHILLIYTFSIHQTTIKIIILLYLPKESILIYTPNLCLKKVNFKILIPIESFKQLIINLCTSVHFGFSNIVKYISQF